MNAIEFERQYAKRSGVTVKWLHEMNRHVFPCHCESPDCIGWQMVNPKTMSLMEVFTMPKYYQRKYERLLK